MTHMITLRQRLSKHVPEVKLSTIKRTSIPRQRLANTRFARQRMGYYGINTRSAANDKHDIVHCKRQIRPLVREGAPCQQTLNCQRINLVLSPKWVLHTKTDWLTDRRS
jgi:hypothetical protein